MTLRRSSRNWLDVLYTSVSKTQGGVEEAAVFLTERRGKAIHHETLRAKLQGRPGEYMHVDMADMLTEWMEEKTTGAEHARDWVQTHAVARHGLALIDVPSAPEGGWPDEMKAMSEKVMRLTSLIGKLSSSALEASDDGVLSAKEKDELYTLFMDVCVMSFRGARNVGRI